MRGRGNKSKKQQRGAEHSENASKHEQGKGQEEHKKKGKKKSKNWRFAYDLYCKELINANQPVQGGERVLE